MDKSKLTKEESFNRQLDITIRRLKNFNPTWTAEQLEQRAKEILADKAKDKEVDIEQLFSDKEEQEVGRDLLKKYLYDYSIETISDRNLLAQLIYFEVLHKRLQKDLNKETDLENKQIYIESLHKNIKEISNLKDKLGISRNKTQEFRKDGFSYLQNLVRKHKKWLGENQGSRYMICPHCGESVLLKIKMDAWEALKHPFFKDRILTNTHLVRLYMEKKLTKTDLSKIFGTSEDYIDWLCDKYNNAWKSEMSDRKNELNDNRTL